MPKEFLYFPWWLENVKGKSKIALFQMNAILTIVFKDENNYIFRKKIS